MNVNYVLSLAEIQKAPAQLDVNNVLVYSVAGGYTNSSAPSIDRNSVYGAFHVSTKRVDRPNHLSRVI